MQMATRELLTAQLPQKRFHAPAAFALACPATRSVPGPQVCRFRWMCGSPARDLDVRLPKTAERLVRHGQDYVTAEMQVRTYLALWLSGC